MKTTPAGIETTALKTKFKTKRDTILDMRMYHGLMGMAMSLSLSLASNICVSVKNTVPIKHNKNTNMAM